MELSLVLCDDLDGWDGGGVEGRSKTEGTAVVVRSPSRVWLCNPKDCSTQGLPVPHHLPEFAQVHVHCIGDAVQSSHPLTPSSPLPSIFPSIRDFSNKSSVRIRWPKYWSFCISSSSEYSGLISLKIDQFDLLVIQGAFRVFSSTTTRRHQLLGVLPFSWSSSHNCTRPLARPYSWLYASLLAE